MTGISASKLILIFAIALVVFGGKRLPEVATSLGQALNNFRQALRGREKDHEKLTQKKEN
jgi:sec-independent protein translocase protein TatA